MLLEGPGFLLSLHDAARNMTWQPVMTKLFRYTTAVQATYILITAA
jgi:hypothetical protein